MIGQFDFSQKGWVSGKGRTAIWCDIDWAKKLVEPQYLMSSTELAASEKSCAGPKVAYMRISSSTNARTTISTYLRGAPAGDSVFFFVPKNEDTRTACIVSGILSSFTFDVVIRQRLGGLNMSEFVMVEAPLPVRASRILNLAIRPLLALSVGDRVFAREWLLLADSQAKALNWQANWATTGARRLEQLAAFNALISCWYGLMPIDLDRALLNCDRPRGAAMTGFDVKGFWRVDKDKDPELRQTVLTLIAFHDLDEKIRKCGGDREKGIETFLSQNNGEGWMLPETLRLADYGLGHDERAKEHQPVASRLEPRYYDWQLAQTPEESWRECHLYARNLLGESGYFNLLSEVLRETAEGGWRETLTFACELSTKENLLRVFEAALGLLPSASWPSRLDEIKPIMTERGFTLDQDELIQLIVEALKRIPVGERPDGLKVCRDLLGDDGHRMVVRRLLASELHHPDGPWHLLASKQLDGTNYQALLAEIEAENHGKLAESAAPYDVSKAKIVQLRLFD